MATSTPNNDPFKCEDGCAACCRCVGHIACLPSQDGVCSHLDGTRCSIYARRPVICRVDTMWITAGRGVSWENWCDSNHKACEALREAQKSKPLPSH